MANENVTNKAVSVGVTLVNVCDEVLPTQRKTITIINTSTAGQKISLGINSDAVVGAGIVLTPGGSFNDSADGNSKNSYFPTCFHISAIADAAGGTLAVSERIGREVL